MTRKRQANYLEPLKGEVKRRFFVTVDIESKDGDTQDPGFTRPFLVGVFDPFRGIYEEFRDEPHLQQSVLWEDRCCRPGGCVDKTMQYLLSPHFNGQNIYAHNGGSFDHLFWLKWLRDHEDEYGFEVIPVQSSIQCLRVWRRPEDPEDPVRERWTFLDSMKLLPMGLDKACRTFGIEGKLEHDLAMHEEDPRWSDYLRQDCVALGEVMMKLHKLVEERLGGEVGMTTPATSMKLYRRRFLGKGKTPKKIPRHVHFPDCVDRVSCLGCCHAWIRRAYYGGRTEPFRTYGENLKYYDFNSSYAASMKDPGGMPAGDRIVMDTLDENLYETHIGFVECTVHVPETCEIPPLPYRDKKTGKLLFPVGRFSGVWDYDELRLLKHPRVGGTILDVKKAVWFRRKHLFEEMVTELFKLRDKSLPGYDEGLSALAKLFVNGNYGKWGMAEERTSIALRGEAPPKGRCLLCKAEVEESVELCLTCEGSAPASDDESVWYQKKRVDASYIVPSIAAHITTLSRIKLFDAFMMVLDRGGQLFYGDTDSILCNVELPTSTVLGELKDEYPDDRLKGIFLQPKAYLIETLRDEDRLHGQHKPTCRDKRCEGCVKGKVTLKGLPMKLRTRENLFAMRDAQEKRARGETLLPGEGEVSYMNLEKIRTLARLAFKRGPRMREVKKSFRSRYDKRILLEDGSTRPVAIYEEDDVDMAAEE